MKDLPFWSIFCTKKKLEGCFGALDGVFSEFPAHEVDIRILSLSLGARLGWVVDRDRGLGMFDIKKEPVLVVCGRFFSAFDGGGATKMLGWCPMEVVYRRCLQT